MHERLVFLDGVFCAESAAAVPALSRGVLYGYGLFETMRSYGGRTFQLESHYTRLCDGTKLLGLDMPLHVDGLRRAVEGVLDANGLRDARLRLSVIAADTPDALRNGSLARTHVVLSARPAADYPEDQYDIGMAAAVSDIRRNERSPLCRVKSLNYLDNLLARLEASRRGADEAILLNSQGLVAEGSASNVFVVKDGALITPSIESGALPGIARRAVLDLARALDLEAVERPVEIRSLIEASEVFLTNSVMEVMPVTSVNGQPVGAGRPGAVARSLRLAYRAVAER